jgi:diguanylate cyclase (GGDEF)-like protein
LENEHRIFLSTERPTSRETRFAVAAALVSVLIFAAVIPFARNPLEPMAAFIPAYESALIISDLVAGVMLFGQFSISRSRGLFVLASGYLFTAFMTFSHALNYPDVFSPGGLPGAGSQTTSWLFLFWHGGFPLFVILYTRFDNEKPDSASVPRGGAETAIIAGVITVLAAVYGLTLIATADHDFLPTFILNDRSATAMTAGASGCWTLSFLALMLLWRRRKRTVLDLWLMVVMCAWLSDIALSAVLNASRFDVGWYAGRIYGLFAANFLLIVLLIESNTHYARLALLSAKLVAANQSLEALSLHDGLTSVANRRFFDTYLTSQIAIARRHKRTLALIMCDIDSFKAYNDLYGHQAGDECLKQVAVALQSCCRRPADMVARYGGEEFAMILPDTELAGASMIAEAARAAVARLQIRHDQSPATSSVSISGGVAVLLRKVDLTAQQLIAKADQTLYQAKDMGRNRMVSVQAEFA